MGRGRGRGEEEPVMGHRYKRMRVQTEHKGSELTGGSRTELPPVGPEWPLARVPYKNKWL